MFEGKFKKLALSLALGCTLLIGGCSGSNKDTVYVGDIEVSDPFEGANRVISDFNQGFDQIILHPFLEGYRFIVPKPARTGLSNLLTTLQSPVSFANQLLQGDLDGAVTTLEKTTINVFVGAGGLFDVAGYEGITVEKEDFGQTLAVWGLDHGPYFVVPFLGPSSLRDYSGYVVDSFMDPFYWWANNDANDEKWFYGKTAANYLVLRESLMDVLQELEASSFDYYASVRSTYYQNRAAMVSDRSPGDFSGSDIPDYDDF